MLVAAVVGAAAVAAVLIVIFAVGAGSSHSSSRPATTTAAPPSHRSLFAGIPQRGFELGKASAPNTLLVFEDPQCPYCKQWNQEALPAVVRDYVRTGRVKLDYRGIEIIGPNSVAGLRANYAAGLQNRLWNMSQALYDRQGEENSGWITTSVIRAAARAAGANPAKVLAAMKSTAVSQALAVATREAQAIRLQGTPTFILQRPLAQPTELQVTALDAQSFEATLAQALQ
jgi:protein-disulfide isomerase